jgi:membrane protease subunit (stomatin/prohibitin family)
MCIRDRRQIGELYYVRKSELRGKFGTKEPIAFRDSDFGMVRIRVFGQFAYRVTEPLLFITQFVGTEGRTSSEAIVDWMRDQIVMSLNDVMGELKRDKSMAVIDMPAYLEEMEQILLARLGDDFSRYGLEMTKIAGLNINLPDEIQKAIDKRGELQALGVNYMQYQAGQAMVRAADNPSGGNLAGLGVGLGAGLGLGQGMAGAVQSGMQPGQTSFEQPQQQGADKPKCPKCGAEYVPGQKFCNRCGNKLMEEIKCIKCSKPISPNDKFCPECGSKQTITCPGCNKELPGDTKFCPECGTKIT